MHEGFLVLLLFNPRAFIPRILRITTHKLGLYIQIVSFVITILWCRWTGIDFPIFQRKFRELKKCVQCDTALTGEQRFKSRLFWLPSQESPLYPMPFLREKQWVQGQCHSLEYSIHSASETPPLSHVKYILDVFLEYFFLPNLIYLSNPAWVSCCFN